MKKSKMLLLFLSIVYIFIFVDNYIKNPHYRLADYIKSNKYRKKLKIYEKVYPNSIAVKYYNELKSKYSKDEIKSVKIDIDILDDIVKDHRLKNPDLNIDEKTAVVHLRTGDVIDNTFIPVKKFVYGKMMKYHNGYNYVKNKKYYDVKIQKLKKLNVDKVLFCSGTHASFFTFKSKEYIREIGKIFKKEGFEVSIRLNKPADDDFALMSGSKIFIPSGGIFSNLISKIVIKNNGNVL